MNGRFAHITRCLDLQERDLTSALETRDTTQELLAHLAAVSSPNTGSAKVLIVLAHMATTACSWIDGDLSIDLVADGDVTIFEVATDLGGGMRERLLAPFSFRAPIAEFARAIERVPHVIAPLGVRTKSPRRVSLSATESLRRTTAPPPPIEISSSSLFAFPPPAGLPTPSPMPVAPALPTVEGSAKESASIRPEDLDSGWED